VDTPDNLHTLYYQAKSGKTLSIGVTSSTMVELGLVTDTDEKLGLGRVWLEAGHRDRTVPMPEAGLGGGLQQDGRQLGWVFAHAQPTLNYLDLDGALGLVIQTHGAVKGCALVAIFIHIPQEVGYRAGGLLGKQLEDYLAQLGLNSYLWVNVHKSLLIAHRATA
jgi:hypothetical protein